MKTMITSFLVCLFYYSPGQMLRGSVSIYSQPLEKGAVKKTQLIHGVKSIQPVLEEQNSKTKGITVFSIEPNPASQLIKLRMLDVKQKINKITVSDMSGKKTIQTQNDLYTSLFMMNVSSLDKGIYMVSITDANGIISSGKLIIE